MKIWCNCNSKFKSGGISEYFMLFGNRQVTKGAGKHCPYCTLFPWYDADYENMMHDLKSMNA